jgi:hypothetical protein
MKVVRSLPLRTNRLYPQEVSWYSLLEAESTPGHMVPSVASEKIPSDTTGDHIIKENNNNLCHSPHNIFIVLFDYVHLEDGRGRQPKHVGVVNKQSQVYFLVFLYKTLHQCTVWNT